MIALRSFVASLFVVTLLSCSGERPPINRVQANALAKSFFVGNLADPADDPEFYMRVTVVDAAAGAGNDGLFTSSDAQPTTRVRWEITEDLLLARLTYELVEDIDDKGVARTPDGQVVAAYAIDSHFDLRHEYNPSTGEELNVIVENDSDRPWHLREYMRIDFSRNLVTAAYDLDTQSQLSIWYGVVWDTVAYYVSDPSHEDAPVFDADRGYFDITGKAWAEPQVLEDEWGPFPACWLIGEFPTLSCNPSEVTLRHSFLRVRDSDYEPIDWDGTRMDLFGMFTVDRFGYDRRYGVVDDRWHRFAARWNVFERSHAEIACNTAETTDVGEDPHRDLVDANGAAAPNGTEDECEKAGAGSRCDDLVGLCTLPLRDRKVKTIPWHVNPEFPAELWDGTAAALQAWSDALRVGLLAGRLAECRRTGAPDCEVQMGWPARWSDDYLPPVGRASLAEVPEVFVLCHNPVDPTQGDDESLCGAAGTRARLGDLRYNFVAVIDEAQWSRPWGIMVDAEDPLTGEKIAGSANVWGATTDRAAATLLDIVSLLNGQIAPDEYITGESIADWVAANQLLGPAEREQGMGADEIASRRGAYSSATIAPYLAGLESNAAVKQKEHPRARHQRRAQALVDAGRLGPGNTALGERVRRLRGSALEAQLVSPELAQLAGFDPTAPLTPEAIDRASPFGRIGPAPRRERKRNALLGRARRHSCRLEGPEPDTLLGLARQVQSLFPAPDPLNPAAVNQWREDVHLWARQQLNQGVLAHELGHSMGLRHNFAASFDSLNYDPRYWQLRTHNGEVTADCADGNDDGASCVGPRWRDPISDEEIDGDIQRFATTSVMDYPGASNQDFLLPGKYDRAALRFAYGGVVDVWQGDGLSVLEGSSRRDEAYKLTAFSVSPGLFGVLYFPPVDPAAPYEFIHYSRYQDEFGLIQNCQDAQEEGAVLGKTCEERPLDVVDYRDLSDFIDSETYAAFDWAYTAKAKDPLGRVRRGYMFSSDEYADAGNVPTFTDDFGADAYEIVRFLETQYENRYIFDAFRRERVDFNSYSVSERIQYKYLDNIQQVAKTFAFGALLDGDPANPDEGLLEDGYYGPLEMAATVALDLYARVLTRPEPGLYCPAEPCALTQPYGVTSEIHNADPVPLPEEYPDLYTHRVTLGDGRYLHNDYDYSQGYWWGDYQTQVGTYYEKVWATYYLAEAFDYFISNAKEDFTDSRYKNVNFATVFPKQVRRLYNNLLTGDYDIYAPWVDAPVASPPDYPVVSIEYPVWHDPDDLGGFPANGLVVDPNYAWNEQVYAMVWGTIFFPTNWSQAFVHEARIAALPYETPDWPDAEVRELFHPASGLTYRARSYGREQQFGFDIEIGAGARMLEWANRLVTVAYLVERDVDDEPILDAYGKPMLVLDVDGNPQLDPDNPGAELVLQRYVDTIDQMRQLIATFELPLDEYDLPQP